MNDRAEQTKRDLIDRIVAVGPADAAAFTRIFYGSLAPSDLASEHLPTLVATVASIWSFAETRPADTAKIRVSRPRGEDGPIVAELVNDDMPFLVDSVVAACARHKLSVELIIHPVVLIERDASGKRIGFGKGKAESIMVLTLSGPVEEAQFAAAEADFARTLSDVRASVADWRAMTALAEQTIEELDEGKKAKKSKKGETAEVRAFLRWLLDNHFTFLGYREYRFEDKGGEATMQVVEKSGLGILRDPSVNVFDGLRNLSALPPEIRAYLERPDPLLIAKSNDSARVHRSVPMDVIGVKQLGPNGKVVAERRFIGLFTSSAYAQNASSIPVVREKIQSVFARAGLDPAGHDGKGLMSILETYPRDELFTISADDLLAIAMGILRLQERRRLALFARKDPFERFVSCLIFVPQERYSFALRQRLQAMLTDAYQGVVTSASAQIYDSPLARLHVIIRTTPGAVPEVDMAALEERLTEAARSWDERLLDAAERTSPLASAAAKRFAGAFSTAYVESIKPAEAVADLLRLHAAQTDLPALHLYRRDPSKADSLAFKIYRPNQPVALSDVLPMLENLGLRVLTEEPWEIRIRKTDEKFWIHDFELAAAPGLAVDVAGIAQRFEAGFLAVWKGEAEDDGFNRLILKAGIDWRQAVIWRAYAKYLRQIGFTFSQAYIEATLDKHAGIAGLLTRLFYARLDPKGASVPATDALLAEIEQALEAVTVLDEDRILRRLVNLVMATLRTNYFQPGADGKPKSYVSFKLDSEKIEELPKPRPHVEVWVYSPAVEAIHLRGGPVARGGIRWSDRREDFRTEILGLIKAQMVKNAVIVPVGSKGGFVVKRLPPASAGRAAQQAEVIESYKTLMRGLLDVTDNRKGGDIVHPKQVVRHDASDPYLVVAADKGTATFSDIANGVAQDYGFWLDDAFASGGSVGYDHKALGITAKGAWVAVERHFREIGVNPNTDEITVVGIGDMAGDVFGNGMLRSETIKLVGAFNHMHIFVDPTPDPKTSFAMRQKLFNTPGSTWADYDRALISAGGAVFERSAKSLKLTPEIKALFGIDADQVTPAELIQTMLKAQVDLIWFGGIGTYIKASTETAADAGDRANDALRVDGNQIRAKVIGEGANLGVTQRGRIEVAANGGRINTDAIDNSAGVDMSDHEVNIKILLSDPIANGLLDLPGRNTLLSSMNDAVSDHVLRDNYLQTFAISMAQAQGPDLIEEAIRLMAILEREAGLDRAIEFLPTNQALTQRRGEGKGLYRPELAVLLAFAKISLYNALLPSKVPDDPALAADLTTYFPERLQERFATEIMRHGLKREIVATVLTNQIVNRGGLTFVSELERNTGKKPDQIARAFVIARGILDLEPLWLEIEALDYHADSAVQLALYRTVASALERTVAWLLGQKLPDDISAATAALDGKLAKLAGVLPVVATELSAEGVPPALATRVATLSRLADNLDILKVADHAGVEITQATDAYMAAGQRFGIQALRTLASGIATPDGWSREALSGLLGDLGHHQQALAAKLIAKGDGWVARKGEGAARLDRLIGELQAAGAPDLARLAVAERAIRELV
jgi:glutamate dehydrogenase